MRPALRVVAQALLLLTSIAVYGTLGALHARGGVLTSVVLVALLTFVAILAHELAHAAAAHMVGARVHAIVAFPLRLRFRPRRLELIKRGPRHGGDPGGYVSYTLDRIDGRRKRAIIAAAGPLANLVLAVLAGTMAPLLDPGLPSGGTVVAVPSDRAALPVDPRATSYGVTSGTLVIDAPPVGAILMFAFALLSAGLGLANLIPYDGSDGAQIAAAWRRRSPR